MLSLYGMNGNETVKSWFTIPLYLSAKASTQKSFAIDSLSSSPIRLGPVVVPYPGPGYAWTSWKSGNTSGLIWAAGCRGALGMIGIGLSLGAFGRVLIIPWWGHFMWPFVVVGLGFRYWRINDSKIFGHPLRKPLCVALSHVEILGLPNDWWANLMVLACVCTKCAKVMILMPAWSAGSNGWRCGAWTIQGPGCSKGRAVMKLPRITHGDGCSGAIAW